MADDGQFPLKAETIHRNAETLTREEWALVCDSLSLYPEETAKTVLNKLLGPPRGSMPPAMRELAALPSPDQIKRWAVRLERVGYSVLRPGDIQLFEKSAKIDLYAARAFAEGDIKNLKVGLTRSMAASIGASLLDAKMTRSSETWLATGVVLTIGAAVVSPQNVTGWPVRTIGDQR